MSVYEPAVEPDPDTYWADEARTDRDEWDAHLRHVEDEERDRLEEYGA